MTTEAARARAEVQAAVVAALRNAPMIVTAVARDLERTPRGRGGILRLDPATEGYGASGCPGDALVAWRDELHAALSDTAALDRMLAEARADEQRKMRAWLDSHAEELVRQAVDRIARAEGEGAT